MFLYEGRWGSHLGEVEFFVHFVPADLVQKGLRDCEYIVSVRRDIGPVGVKGVLIECYSLIDAKYALIAALYDFGMGDPKRAVERARKGSVC